MEGLWKEHFQGFIDHMSKNLANNQNPWMRVRANNTVLSENYSPNVANRYEKKFDTLINDTNIMGNVSPETVRSNPDK